MMCCIPQPMFSEGAVKRVFVSETVADQSNNFPDVILLVPLDMAG